MLFSLRKQKFAIIYTEGNEEANAQENHITQSAPSQCSHLRDAHGTVTLIVPKLGLLTWGH